MLLFIHHSFINRLRKRTTKPITGLTSQAMACFMAYQWPGNVRELKSALEYAFVIAEGGLIDLDQLPPKITNQKGQERELSISSPQVDHPEKEALIQALRQSGGNQSQAARILGVNRVTVWNRMKKYGIDLKRVLTS